MCDDIFGLDMDLDTDSCIDDLYLASTLFDDEDNTDEDDDEDNDEY